MGLRLRTLRLQRCGRRWLAQTEATACMHTSYRLRTRTWCETAAVRPQNIPVVQHAACTHAGCWCLASSDVKFRLTHCAQAPQHVASPGACRANTRRCTRSGGATSPTSRALLAPRWSQRTRRSCGLTADTSCRQARELEPLGVVRDEIPAICVIRHQLSKHHHTVHAVLTSVLSKYRCDLGGCWDVSVFLNRQSSNWGQAGRCRRQTRQGCLTCQHGWQRTCRKAHAWVWTLSCTRLTALASCRCFYYCVCDSRRQLMFGECV